jgi:hypothetical protein
MQFDANYALWRQRTIAMNKILISMQNFGADSFVECSLSCAVLFWFYSAILFGCLVLFFLIRILWYKFGYLDLDETLTRHCPHKKVPCQFCSHNSPTRRKRTYKKTRWKRNIKRDGTTRRTSSAINLMSVIPSIAFTTVLNIDDRVNTL